MTIAMKPYTGLALNQNIVLEHLYKLETDEVYANERKRCHNHSTWRPGYKQHLGLTKKQYTKAMACLKNRGYLEVRENCSWQLTNKGVNAVVSNDYIKSGPMGPHTGVRTPPKGTLSSYVWAALRAKNSATIEELLSLVPIEDEDYDKTERSTRRLLFWLCKAMIVRRMPRKKEGYHYNSRGHTRYQLMMDLGTKHPIIRQRKHQVYDPNSQVNVPFKDALKAFKR